MCSLADMLAARDRRQEWQERHFREHPAVTLIVATVVAPGERKLTPQTAVVADAMTEALRAQFAGRLLTLARHDLVSGHELWLTLSCSPDEAKQTAVGIEDSHPLGRLFDIDVIRPDLRPISRAERGLPPRRCLLCDNEARLCMRLHLHSREEIARHIEAMIRKYSPPYRGGAGGEAL